MRVGDKLHGHTFGISRCYCLLQRRSVVSGFGTCSGICYVWIENPIREGNALREDDLQHNCVVIVLRSGFLSSLAFSFHLKCLAVTFWCGLQCGADC